MSLISTWIVEVCGEAYQRFGDTRMSCWNAEPADSFSASGTQTVRVYRDVFAPRRYRTLWPGATVTSIRDSVCLLALIWLLYSGGHSVREVHLTTPLESGFRVVEIWDHKEGFDRFLEARLAPAGEAVGLQREMVITVKPLHNFFAPRLKELPGLISSLPGVPASAVVA